MALLSQNGAGIQILAASGIYLKLIVLSNCNRLPARFEELRYEW